MGNKVGCPRFYCLWVDRNLTPQERKKQIVKRIEMFETAVEVAVDVAEVVVEKVVEAVEETYEDS